MQHSIKMKRYLIVFALLSVFAACVPKDNESQEKLALKVLRIHDSLLAIQARGQDSTVTAYIEAFNQIQDNLDSIKQKSDIITVNATEGKDKKADIISDMRYISDLMNKNKHALADMQKKLNASGLKNAELTKMISHLTEELTQKDADIAALQSQLAEVSANLKEVMKSFNDSMVVINNKNGEIQQDNTVYYAIGTTKELKKQGVIVKKGGVLGVGSIVEMKTNTNVSYFTSGDMNNIHALPLYSKFDKLITQHPSSAYTIHGNKKVDSLIITDPKAFWSESKFLVVTVKQPHKEE